MNGVFPSDVQAVVIVDVVGVRDPAPVGCVGLWKIQRIAHVVTRIAAAVGIVLIAGSRYSGDVLHADAHGVIRIAAIRAHA